MSNWYIYRAIQWDYLIRGSFLLPRLSGTWRSHLFHTMVQWQSYPDHICPSDGKQWQQQYRWPRWQNRLQTPQGYWKGPGSKNTMQKISWEMKRQHFCLEMLNIYLEIRHVHTKVNKRIQTHNKVWKADGIWWYQHAPSKRCQVVTRTSGVHGQGFCCGVAAWPTPRVPAGIIICTGWHIYCCRDIVGKVLVLVVDGDCVGGRGIKWTKT